jgi:hypothetical protein
MAKKTAKRKKAAKRSKRYAKHTGHANHLCALVAKREMDKVATLAAGAKYVCHVCGRAAAKATNLCEPVKI